MKKSLMVVGILAMMSAASAFAAEPRHDDLFRFDFNCSFSNASVCTAQARVFRKIDADRNGDAPMPEWVANLLAVQCDGQLISAGEASVRRSHFDTFEIESVSHAVEVELASDPFTGQSITGIAATLMFDHTRLAGTCNVVATAITPTNMPN